MIDMHNDLMRETQELLDEIDALLAALDPSYDPVKEEISCMKMATDFYALCCRCEEVSWLVKPKYPEEILQKRTEEGSTQSLLFFCPCCRQAFRTPLWARHWGDLDLI